jgi:Ca-activated chloride channel homolog
MRTLAALFSLSIVLQQAPAPQSMQKVVVNVTDVQGRYIVNLTEKDFILEQNGAPQKIASFAPDSDAPISFGLLIDKSTSMRLPIYGQGQAASPAALLVGAGIGRAIVRLMKPQDEFMLMTFDESLQVKQNFTQDHKKIEDELYKLHYVGGATHLYESIFKALDRMKKAKHRRRALIVITDAYDTSGKQLEEFRDKLAAEEIQIFMCGLRSVMENITDPQAEPLFQLVLRTFSGETGGLSMIVDVPDYQKDASVEGLIGFSRIIAMELRGQYTLGYYGDKTVSASVLPVRVRVNYPGLMVRVRRDTEEPPKK